MIKLLSYNDLLSLNDLGLNVLHLHQKFILFYLFILEFQQSEIYFTFFLYSKLPNYKLKILVCRCRPSLVYIMMWRSSCVAVNCIGSSLLLGC